MWSAGQRIGDYELLAKLREGGMATLYLARRSGASGFARHVAIKVIHRDLAQDEQFRQMFLDEALLSSRIQHPNVVQVEELGQHQGAHFLAMEFVHGCSLSELQRTLSARGRRLAPAFATRIAMHVAEALHAAHETCDESGRPLNVVHRDVTPENILLAYAGHVKLVDFGIAKAFGRRHRTQDGLLKGKFRYMAPEQAHGKAVDRRVDIYQLGIVLWEMLTLRRLFDAEGDLDLLNAVRKPSVRPPSMLVDRIPPALDAAVMAALEPQPKRRPVDAQSFARLLARAVPSAYEVDAGALRALLLATMQEHRRRDRTTYPPGVYDRLDQPEADAHAGRERRADARAGGRSDVETEPLGGVDRQAATRAADAIRVYTIEHTAPYGSDTNTAAANERPTRAGERARRARASARGAPASLPAARLGRPRRLVRLVSFAGELSTALSRVVRTDLGARALWLALGGAVGVAILLAAVVLALQRGARSVPRLPELPPPLPLEERGREPGR